MKFLKLMKEEGDLWSAGSYIEEFEEDMQAEWRRGWIEAKMLQLMKRNEGQGQSFDLGRYFVLEDENGDESARICLN